MRTRARTNARVASVALRYHLYAVAQVISPAVAHRAFKWTVITKYYIIFKNWRARPQLLCSLQEMLPLRSTRLPSGVGMEQTLLGFLGDVEAEAHATDIEIGADLEPDW